MKIMFDLGHPAHVHYFRNAIRELEQKGHKVLVTARDKEMTHALLKLYSIPFHSRGTGASSLFGKGLYFAKALKILSRLARTFQPDLFVSFASPYCAQVSKIFRKPHIAFADTEHAKLNALFVLPCTDLMVTPERYRVDHGKKQLRFNGLIELAYLHPKRYTPDASVKELLGVRADESYAIVRFVSWRAIHDVGHRGFTLEKKIRLVEELSKHLRVFVSSEDELPAELSAHRMQIPFTRIHDALAHASLFVGESGTMSTEAALVGTPAVNVSTSATAIGTFQAIADYGLMHVIPDNDKAIAKSLEIVTNPNSQYMAQSQLERLFDDYIDVTDFMVRLIEGYPGSADPNLSVHHLDRSFASAGSSR